MTWGSLLQVDCSDVFRNEGDVKLLWDLMKVGWKIVFDENCKGLKRYNAKPSIT